MGTGITLTRVVVAALTVALAFLVLALLLAAGGADGAVMAGITYTGAG